MLFQSEYAGWMYLLPSESVNDVMNVASFIPTPNTVFLRVRFLMEGAVDSIVFIMYSVIFIPIPPIQPEIKRSTQEKPIS
jgi:hypothetical protein